MIRVRAFGTTAGDAVRPRADVRLVELASSALQVQLLTLGASIASVECADERGTTGPIHLSLGSLAEYENVRLNPHLGATIGRYANRIAGASFSLAGRQVHLVANNGPNQLHGGPRGWDRQVWDLVDVDDDPAGGSVRFRLTSPDGDQGFPATVTAEATYTLAGDTLTIAYSATTDAPTVVNMTNHGYWNLGGAPTVHDHHIQMIADHVLPVDDSGIPTGGLAPVEGAAFDLRSRVELGTAMAAAGGGFDHCFAVRGHAAATPGELRRAAVVDAPTTGRWMEISTDQPGVQLYTGNGLRSPFVSHGSVSLETQLFPDTPNRPELGSALLLPDDRYLSTTELRFGVGQPPPSDR